jgi:hypothetical protein
MDALHTVVPRALAELLRNGPMSQGKLDVAWRAAVGDALSRVSTIKLQADGSVHVQPADPRWQKELKRSSPVILQRLNMLLGAKVIARIIVK